MCLPLPHGAHPASLRGHRSWWPIAVAPGHTNFAGTQFRDCERSLPDPEVNHAQAEKEVAQAAPRFPIHSPCWSPGPRAELR